MPEYSLESGKRGYKTKRRQDMDSSDGVGWLDQNRTTDQIDFLFILKGIYCPLHGYWSNIVVDTLILGLL